MSAGVNPTVAWLALRSLFGRRRGVVLFVLPLVLLALAVGVRLLSSSSTSVTNLVLYGLGLVVVMPLVALVATTGVVSSEIDDGSVVYLLAKPVSRLSIMVSKLLVALGCVAVFGAVPLLVAGLVLDLDEPQVAVAYALGGLVGGIAYCALFALVSVLTRHAVVVGLLYVLIWEGVLGGLMDGIRWLSVTRWAAAITDRLADEVGISDKLSWGYAAGAALVVLVLGTWLSAQRLRSYSFRGDE